MDNIGSAFRYFAGNAGDLCRCDRGAERLNGYDGIPTGGGRREMIRQKAENRKGKERQRGLPGNRKNEKEQMQIYDSIVRDGGSFAVGWLWREQFAG